MSKTLSHPGRILLDRLMLGYSEPDQELYHRANIFRAWAEKHPREALGWIPRLRRTHPITARLWKAVEDIVDPRSGAIILNSPTPPMRPAVPAPRQQPPLQGPIPFPAAYEAWKKRNIREDSLAGARRCAPALAQEAVELESRARNVAALASQQEVLQRAARIWATLLNIKEPLSWETK